MVERRVNIGTTGALVGLAAVAWILTVQQALGMSDMVTGLAPVGSHMPNPMTAPVFMRMWLTMMVAMMFRRSCRWSWHIVLCPASGRRCAAMGRFRARLPRGSRLA